MERIKKSDIPGLSLENRVSISNTAEVYHLPDDKFIKIFKPAFLLSSSGFNLEKSLSFATKLPESTSIMIPDCAVTSDDGELIIGFGGDWSNDVSLSSRINATPNFNNSNLLYDLTNLYLALEDAVKREKKFDVVFPDLCSTDNTKVSKDLDIHFIDYDGLQLGNNPSSCGFSSALLEFLIHNMGSYVKRSNGTLVFNGKIDMVSLLIVYFGIVFGVKLPRMFYGAELPHNFSINGVPNPIYANAFLNNVIGGELLLFLNLYNKDICKARLNCWLNALGFDREAVEEITGYFLDIKNAHYFGLTAKRIMAQYRLVPATVLDPTTRRPVPVRRLVRK